MKRRVFIHLAYFLALGLAFAGAVALAGSVGTLTTFSPNTVAKSSEVNGNFSAVETAVNDNDTRITANAAAIPLAWGQSDVDLLSSSSIAPSGAVEINSLPIDVPSDGILVISGSVYIENGAGFSQNYVLLPLVDGVGVPVQTLSGSVSNDFAAQFNAAGTGPSAQFTLSYTVTVPITAGPYIVSQYAGPYVGTVLFSYNKNYLTVVFYPSSKGTFIEAPADADF